jgi:signal transduction histidine kinase
VVFEHNGLHRKFAGDINIAAYRIVQEALNNVARHAGVREARVTARADRRILHLRIEDQGYGFDPGGQPDDGRQGLVAIRGRAMLVGGIVQIYSRPGTGTVVVAELPLSQARPVKGGGN